MNYEWMIQMILHCSGTNKTNIKAWLGLDEKNPVNLHVWMLFMIKWVNELIENRQIIL